MTASVLPPLIVTFGPPLMTLAVGFVAGRLSMTMKERKDIEQKNFENTHDLVARHDAAYGAYSDAIAEFAGAPDTSSALFVAIATTGDRYYYQLNLMCAAILSGKVDRDTRDNVLLAKIRGVTERTLETHYEVLQDLAGRHEIPFEGGLRREDYAAIYAVIEKYGGTPSWNGFEAKGDAPD